VTAGRNSVSDNKDWGTPPKYVAAVKRFFGGEIALDPCSNEFSVVHAQTEYMLPCNDGLTDPWDYPTIYVNPPYGADKGQGTRIGHWLRRCATAHHEHGSEVLALVPVAVNTGHWKRYVWTQATSVCFLYDTRLRFLVRGLDEGKGAPMACAMIYWGGDYERFLRVFLQYGAVVDIRPLWGLSIGAGTPGAHLQKELALGPAM
jgi:hypothetical protein